MPSSINDLATSFTITELTGPKRELVLYGRGLPYRPFTLEGSQRNTNEWYPGSPVSSMQVYGSEEKPTTINGWWKDIFIGEHLVSGQQAAAELNGIEIDDVRQLATIVDSIRRTGQEIRVTWLNQIRTGILEHFTQKWHTGHDLEWEISFEWGSQGENLDDIPFVDGFASDLADVPNQIQTQVDRFVGGAACFTTVFDSIYQATIGKVDTAIATVQGYVDALSDTAANLAGAINTSSDAARRTIAILDGIKNASDDIHDTLEDSIEGARMNLSASGTDVLQLYGSVDVGARPSATGGFGAELADRLTIRAQSDAAQTARATAANAQRNLLSSVQSPTVAVFQAKDGDDFRRVAIKYYGTESGWRGLMIYNHALSDELRAGQLVLVPARPPGGDV